MKKKWYVVLMIALFIFQGIALSAADQPPKKVVKLMQKAEKAMKKQDFEKAMENYNKALELAPEYGPIHFGIARIQINQKKMAEGIASLEKALKLDPANTQTKQTLTKVLYQSARQAWQQRKAKEAGDFYGKIVAIEGIDALEQKIYIDSLTQLGNIKGMEKKFKESNDFYKKVLAIPGVDTTEKKLALQLLYRVGLNFYNMQKFKEATAQFEKVIAFPDAQTEDVNVFTISHYLVGLNAAQVKDYAKSNDMMTKFLAMEGKSEQLTPLANFIMGTNHMEMLEAKVQKVREDKKVKDKDKKKAIENLAKKHPQVAEYLNKALQLNPMEPAYMHLGNYYYYTGDSAKAVQSYEALVSKYPTSPDIASYQKFLEQIKKKK